MLSALTRVPPGHLPPIRGGSRARITALAVGILAGALVLLGAIAPLPGGLRTTLAHAASRPALTFSATIRATQLEAIFTAAADGTDIRRISPADGRNYGWGRFAFGNTKIIYTVRSGAKNSPESIGLMNLDGSSPQILRNFEYRVLQPVVDPTGRWITYTANAPFFPRYSIFRLDLVTNTVTNLTAKTRPSGTFDADPVLSNSGDRVLFVEDTKGRGTTISAMKPDGTSRKALTTGQYFNTDPSFAADGKAIAISSYRGYDLPSQAGGPQNHAGLAPEYFSIIVQGSTLGAPERVLTSGGYCTIRTPAEACSVQEMSAWQPRFTPDQRSVSFIGALDWTRTCICAIDTDGTNGRTIIASTELSMNWQDWEQPAGYSTSTASIGKLERKSSLLLVMAGPDKIKRLVIGSPDMANRIAVPLPVGLQPLDAIWGPKLDTIVFTARVKVGAKVAPHPSVPAGSKRKVHPKHPKPKKLSKSVAEQQVFSFNTKTTVLTQLTDPWIEDWRDGLAAGDQRANTEPELSPDGRYLVVTNTSTLTGESFLLRLDLRTGAVLNLTHGSKEAAPSSDAQASFAPNGKKLAFTRVVKSKRTLYTMNPSGSGPLRLRSDPYAATAPAWAPNGAALLYVSAKKSGAVVVKSKITGGTKAGTPVTISKAKSAAPVVAPEGDALALIYQSKINFRSMSGSAAPQVNQPDRVFTAYTVDWGRR